jgi:hypothetical protein
MLTPLLTNLTVTVHKLHIVKTRRGLAQLSEAGVTRASRRKGSPQIEFDDVNA